MKYLILAGIIFVVVTFAMRKRREEEAQREEEARRERAKSRRGSSMYDTKDGAVNVRSADNVRLISEDQLDAIEDDNK